MKRRCLGVLISILLMTNLLAGCSKTESAAGEEMLSEAITEEESTSSENGPGNLSAQDLVSKEGVKDKDAEGSGEKAMGRYQEEKLPVPEGLAMAGEFVKTEAGFWLLEIQSDTGVWFMPEGSDTWEKKTLPEVFNSTYIVSSTVSETGELALASFEKKEDESDLYENVIRVVQADGSVKEISRDSKCSVGDMVYGPDNMLYVHKSGISGIYRYDTKTAEEEKLFFASSVIEKLTFVGNRLLALDDGQVMIYNIETGELEENDPVLDDFLKENKDSLGGFGSHDSGVHVAVIFGSWEEDVVYLSFSKGVYRHVLYGNVMEQLIDGELSSFGDPSKMQQGIAAIEEEDGSVSFQTLFFKNNLVKFTYDATVPTVPDITLKVYSLNESTAVRQAIALFQQKYPQCYVQYEVGLSGIGAANVDDKLKNLNTALIGGNGPDVLIMDGLETENYSSKGILEDMTPLLESISTEEKLLSNVVETMKTEGRIYTMPARFSIPMIAGEKEYFEDVKDLNSLAFATEKLRKAYPEGVLLGSSLPECILTMLAQTEGFKWIENGTLQEEELKDFLLQAARIYEAELVGVTAERIEEERTRLSDSSYYSNLELNTQVKTYYYSLNSSTVGVLLKDHKTAMGYANAGFDFCYAELLPENYILRPIADEQGVGFMPVMKLAISSQSSQKEMAEAFVELVLSEEFQSINLGDGAPVNVTALEKFLEPQQDLYVGLGGTDAEGNPVELSAGWPSEETIDCYRKAIEEMNHSLDFNKYLVDTVVEIGSKMLKEDMPAKEAVDEIKKKTAIYLAE